MDCRHFRQHHLAYVDDTLPGALLVAAEAHVLECPACRAQDTLVRRSLLLARNLPPVECSADFDARLEARLAELRCGRPLPSLRVDDDALTGDADFLLPVAGHGGVTTRAAHAARARVGRSLGAARTTLRTGTPRVAALAASLLMAAGVGVVWRDAQEPTVFAVPGAVAGAPLDGGQGTATAGASAEAPVVAQAGMTAAAVTPVVAPARRVFRAVRAAAPTRVADAQDLADSLDGDEGSLASTGMMVPAAVGVSVWPAAILAGEMPVEMLRARVRRGGGAQSGVTLVDLRR